MKKLLILLFIIIFSCTTDEGENEEEMCCGTPLAVIIESMHKMYNLQLSNENLTAARRKEIEDERDRRLENPCYYHKKGLEGVGSSCENPN